MIVLCNVYCLCFDLFVSGELVSFEAHVLNSSVLHHLCERKFVDV